MMCCLVGVALAARVALVRQAGFALAAAAFLAGGLLAADHVAARAAMSDFDNPPLCLTEKVAIALRQDAF